MKCPNCGAETSEKTDYCGLCYAPLVDKPSLRDNYIPPAVEKQARKKIIPLKTLILTNTPIYFVLLVLNYDTVNRAIHFPVKGAYLISITMALFQIILFLYWAILPILLIVTFSRTAVLFGSKSYMIPVIILVYYLSTVFTFSYSGTPALFVLMVLFTSILIGNLLFIGLLKLPVVNAIDDGETTK